MAGLITDYLQRGHGAPSGAPDIPSTEYGIYEDIDTGTFYYWDLFALVWNTFSVTSLDYPKRATMWHDESLVTVGNALVRTHDTAQNYASFAQQNTSANGDTFTQSFVVTGGTYTLAVLAITGGASAKLDWYIDNVLQGAGGQDWYSASGVYNVVKTLSVTVVSDGYHVLKGVVNGKNGSSSGYNIQATKFWLYASAD